MNLDITAYCASRLDLKPDICTAVLPLVISTLLIYKCLYSFGQTDMLPEFVPSVFGLFAFLLSLLLGFFQLFRLLSFLLSNDFDGALHLYAFGSALVLAVFVRGRASQ